MIEDADAFLSNWGRAAHDFGWTALDLYGVHPLSAAARFDVMGILFLIQGGDVIALTSSSATVRKRSGALLTYRRPETRGAVLPYEILGNNRLGAQNRRQSRK